MENIALFDIISRAVLPVVLFLSGFLLNKWIESRKKSKERELFFNYYLDFVNQLHSYLMTYSRELIPFARALANPKILEFNPNLSPQNYFKAIKNISTEEIYKNLLPRKKVIHDRSILFDIMRCNDVLSEGLQSLEELISKYQKFDSEFIHSWNKSLELLPVLMRKEAKDNGLWSIHENFYKSRTDISIHTSYENLVLPLLRKIEIGDYENLNELHLKLIDMQSQYWKLKKEIALLRLGLINHARSYNYFSIKLRNLVYAIK